MLIFKLSHPSADGLLSLKISQALFLTLSYQRLLKTGVFVQALCNLQENKLILLRQDFDVCTQNSGFLIKILQISKIIRDLIFMEI
ncbi:MAG: hypothetical protein U9R19_11525, partial [Bacteroidota bacterium]|nr:hypothetical protein [Bacteroidota bacterium]